jgi:hypothetical protein
VTGKKLNHCSVYAKQVSNFHYKFCSNLLTTWKKKTVGTTFICAAGICLKGLFFWLRFIVSLHSHTTEQTGLTVSSTSFSDFLLLISCLFYGWPVLLARSFQTTHCGVLVSISADLETGYSNWICHDFSNTLDKFCHDFFFDIICYLHGTDLWISRHLLCSMCSCFGRVCFIQMWK